MSPAANKLVAGGNEPLYTNSRGCSLILHNHCNSSYLVLHDLSILHCIVILCNAHVQLSLIRPFGLP
jgi:hypothetical protein